MSTGKMWNEKLIEMFDNEELTDCIFQLKGSSTSSEEEIGLEQDLVRAHKVVLCTESKVLKAMLSEQLKSNQKLILIENIDAELFKMFIRTIYTKTLSVNDLETVINLHKLADMYQTYDISELTTNFMIKNCDAKNVLAITDFAWTFGNKILRNSCKMALAKYTTEILNSDEFLETKLESVKKLFSLKALNIASENLLVTSLDKYINHNKNTIPDIMPKLKIAIESIRILLVTDDIINECSNETFKAILLERKRKFSDAQNIYYFKQGMGQPRDKPTLLSRLPVKMLRLLFTLFYYTIRVERPVSQVDISDPRLQPNELSLNLYGIHDKYNHGRLEEYSDDDIKAILEEFKIAGLSAGSSSEYNVFINYETYLEI